MDDDNGRLGFYATEILRDVAEAKQSGGISIYHSPDTSRVRTSHIQAAARQLFSRRIFVTQLGNDVRIHW